MLYLTITAFTESVDEFEQVVGELEIFNNKLRPLVTSLWQSQRIAQQLG
jgi:hypothetical protein